MSLQKETFSSIVSITAESYDDFYQFKQRTHQFAEGFSLNNIEALRNIADFQINNYSGLALTGKLKDSDIYNFQTKEIAINTVVGQIKYGDKFLYFDDIQNLPIPADQRVLYLNSNSVSFRLSTGFVDTNNSYFEILIVNDIFCKIRHIYDDSHYYLVYNPGNFEENDFYFTRTPNTYCVSSYGTDESTFYCLYDSDDGYISLHKTLTTGTSGSDTRCFKESDGVPVLVSPLSGEYIDLPDYVGRVSTESTIPLKINTSWVSYSIDNVEDQSINSQKSRFNIDNNHLLSFEYSNMEDVVRFKDLKLKNNHTITNSMQRGNVFGLEDKRYPSVNYRDYTGIFSGNDEERGYHNIILNYTVYDKDITINPEGTTMFYTSSSLYPYEQLNINDTAFVENGSFGGTSPIISDKIYRNTEQNRSYKNGQYLVTWLSSGGFDSPGTWVDRYYVPDLVSKRRALSAISIHSPTFANEYENIIFNNSQGIDVSVNPIIDKTSDMVFTPNTGYTYERINSSSISQFVSSFNDLVYDKILNFQNRHGTTTLKEPVNDITLNGNRFTSIPTTSINETNSYTLKFEYNFDWANDDFFQFMGNVYSTGVGIYKNENITPFIYTFSANTIRVYNSNFNFVYETPVVNDVVSLFPTKYLNDVIIIDSGGNIFKMTTSGVIRQYLQGTITPGYTSSCQDDTYIYLLYDTGSAVSINIQTLDIEDVNVTAFSSSVSGNTIAVINDDLYSISGEFTKFSDRFGYTLYNNVISRIDFELGVEETFATSLSTVNDFTIDDEQCIYVSHGDKLGKLSKNRQLIATSNLSSYGISVKKLDIINEIDNSGKIIQDVVASGVAADGSLSFIRLDRDLMVKSSVITNTQYSGSKSSLPLTKYNIFGYTHGNDIRFSVSLVNIYDRKDNIIKYIDIDQNRLPFHGTICIRVDTVQGNFTVFANNQKIGNESFAPGEYRLDDLLVDNIFIGTTGFYNNTPLNEFIKMPDLYNISDASVKNIKIYNRALLDYEIQSLLMEGYDIQPLTISIPWGQRNNLDEVRRMFFFAPPTSKATDVDIIVKNSTIYNNETQAHIIDRIMLDIKKTLPGHVNINNIRFENYK